MPLLFSYGTLQEDSVQLAIFGRRLEGQRDALVGFECSPIEIENLQFVATVNYIPVKTMLMYFKGKKYTSGFE